MGLFGNKKNFNALIENKGNLIDSIKNGKGEILELYDNVVIYYNKNHEIKNAIEINNIQSLEREVESKNDKLTIKANDKIVFKINNEFRDDLKHFSELLSDMADVTQRILLGDIDEIRKRRAEILENEMQSFDFYEPHSFHVIFPTKVKSSEFVRAMGAYLGKKYLGSSLAGYALLSGDVRFEGNFFFRFAERGIVFEKGNPDGTDNRIPWENIDDVFFNKDWLMIKLTNGQMIFMSTRDYTRREEVYVFHKAYVDAILDKIPSIKENDGW